MQIIEDKLKKIVVFIIVIICNASIVCAAPSCVFVEFSDESSYSNLDTKNLLADVLTEKILNNNIFSVKEIKKIDSDIDKMYIDNYEEMDELKKGESIGDYSGIFNDLSFGVKKSKKIYESVKGDVVYPNIIKNIAVTNGVSYIIHGTVKQAISYEESDVTFRNFLLQMVGTKENKVEVRAYIRVIDGRDGTVIWGEEINGVGDKLKGNVSGVSFGGKRYDSSMYYNAVDKLTENLINKINNDIASGNLILDDKGE